MNNTDHECCNCINGEFIEVDIDIWDWTCMYCYQENDEDCDDCYGKASCLTASMWKGQKASYTKNSNGQAHKFTPLECERLQTLPENYTDNVCNTNRYKAIGNGWTVDVVAHIFKGIM